MPLDARRDHGVDDLLRDRRVLLRREDLFLFDDEDGLLLYERTWRHLRLLVQRFLEFVFDFVLELDLLHHGLRRAADNGSRARRHGGRRRRRWRQRLGGGGDQVARELPDQALQRPEIAGDLLPLGVLASPSRSARTASILACTSSNSLLT